MSGFLGNLSPHQEEALRIFRRKVEDLSDKPDSTDQYYLKWLRARKFDVDAALQMFRNHLYWRKEWDVDNIFNWTPPEVFEKWVPGSFFGEDKNGHPVFYDFLGNLDVKGIYRSCKPKDGIRYKILHAELGSKLFKDQSEKHGRNIETITSVENMENLSYQRQYHWQGIQLIRKIFSFYADNYPERTEAIFIINAPRVFPLVFNLFKPFMAEHTKNRIFVLGDDYQEVLLQHIAPDQLPEAFGGTRREPDAECTNYLNWAGLIPDSYYLTNQTTIKREDMNKVTIGRGSTHFLEVEVKTMGSLIRWEFITEGYDIGFGLQYKPAVNETRSETVTLIKTKRRNSHVVPEEGVHHCQEIGTYVLQFDNTHSWIRPKELYYSVEYQELDDNISTPKVLTEEQGLKQEEKPEEANKDEFENCVEGMSEMGLESPDT